jgi:hypothetical protein
MMPPVDVGKAAPRQRIVNGLAGRGLEQAFADEGRWKELVGEANTGDLGQLVTADPLQVAVRAFKAVAGQPPLADANPEEGCTAELKAVSPQFRRNIPEDSAGQRPKRHSSVYPLAREPMLSATSARPNRPIVRLRRYRSMAAEPSFRCIDPKVRNRGQDG